MYQFLATRRDGPVEHLTLNRPDVRNAFNERLIAELTDWTARAAEAAARAGSSALRVVVLAGAGKVFSAGADVAWMARTAQYSDAENVRDATAASRMFAALDALPVALVGRIHGAALGGGAGLAAVCDVAIAEEQTQFGFTEVKLGIVPAVISPFVIAKIGRSAARELFVTGARFSAARAREIGLIHAVVPAQELDGTVARSVSDILDGGPEAIATVKMLIREVANRPTDDATEITARTIAERRASQEGQEGLTAFLEKRKPSWS